MRAMTVEEMGEIEGGSIWKIAQVGCATYGVYGVAALILGGPVSIAAGVFCAGVGIGSLF